MIYKKGDKMVYYQYNVFFVHEYDYARYFEGEKSVYSKIHIPKDEWKQIVSKAFKAVFEKHGKLFGLESITEYIVKNDNRFIAEDELFIPVKSSELWEPYWDNWNVDEYDPQTMIMCKNEEDDIDDAVFLIP